MLAAVVAEVAPVAAVLAEVAPVAAVLAEVAPVAVVVIIINCLSYDLGFRGLN